MAKLTLRSIFFLVIALWLSAGCAFTFACSQDREKASTYSQSQGDTDPFNATDPQDTSPGETDNEEFDDDDDPTDVHPKYAVQLAVHVNLAYQFQFALFREHHPETLSPPPKV